VARCVALLRAVNLGPHKKVAMADLKAMFVALGFEDAKTLLISGNVVFEAGRKTPAALEKLLEAEAAKRLKLNTEFFVRSAAQWEEMLAANPFKAMAKDDPSHLVVFALKDAPNAAAVKQLNDADGPEEVKAVGHTLYISYPNNIGDSKLNANAGWKKLGTPCTGRNWNTAQKIAALLSAA
jgi:uncharacterized protein (DUF1697 family)